MLPISRRRVLVAGAAGAGAVAAGAAGFGLGERAADATPVSAGGAEPFYGAHQAGIATAQQDRVLFASYDLTTGSSADVRQLLDDWTVAAARIVDGLPAAPEAASTQLPPTDSGESIGLDPAHLTLTFGFGPALFERDGVDRFGLSARRPGALVDLPAFSGDALDTARSGGDLCVQACANDPQVAYHAVRNLTRVGLGKVALRWMQQGFGRTAATTPDQSTPRNLLGFKDGTNNLRAGDRDFDDHVWVAAGDGPDWMVDGTYLVARRIRMQTDAWDRSSLGEQQETIGRTKREGAPLGAVHEHDPLDLDAKGNDGKPVIPTDAHVRLAHQASTGIFLLRRGYSFTDGVDPSTGQLDAGLFFLAYQRDPRAQFIPLQQRLAANDALNEYVEHVGSAIFAVPPGVQPGRSIGASLFR